MKGDGLVQPARRLAGGKGTSLFGLHSALANESSVMTHGH